MDPSQHPPDVDPVVRAKLKLAVRRLKRRAEQQAETSYYGFSPPSAELYSSYGDAAKMKCTTRHRPAGRITLTARPRERRTGTPRSAGRRTTRSSASEPSGPAPSDPDPFADWDAWLSLSSKRGRCPYCGYRLIRGLCPNASCCGWS